MLRLRCCLKGVDPETLGRLENALGKAAVKRKGGAVDEEEVSLRAPLLIHLVVGVDARSWEV